ncbi:DUF5606 domain-containing protein [Wenyingzhuangia sp. 2_MG-2023]|uniref:DUF5606 family protein n=1 Tax=Wenyingzhuangia sp. 2_MG-2023 TaxID=3062639 RepID=UPI0026E16B59|nr:DUF5606 domain-containing protein [Wenyingzhuangia sp. 2_MG-2023]MDO6738439.1 DUF5606 domain-containing protein [Wenyingzhuangia sp. 2_MG-2023]MDO6803338.1 DUF5606 domain-containing protein [Wenyingzhuangia sp. 1_MG-2023]
MSLTKVIAISGKPGLYEILGQTKGGFITSSLLDGKKTPVKNTQNVSVLSDIGIYTYETEVALGIVFIAIHDKYEGKASISHKASDKELVALFNEVLPDYDEERVYVSNIKKVVQWYNILVNAEFDFETIKEDLKKLEEAQNAPQ